MKIIKIKCPWCGRIVLKRDNGGRICRKCKRDALKKVDTQSADVLHFMEKLK